MTTIHSYYTNIDMSNFSLAFLLGGSSDPLSQIQIYSYSEDEVTIGGYNGGHGYVVLEGDFPAGHDINEIPDDATITGFRMVDVGSLGPQLALAVEGISVSWADITTSSDFLMQGGSVSFVGRRASETAYGSSKMDDFAMGAGKDKVFAGGSIDFLKGGAGADYLAGGAGNDVIEGGIGNDTLVGGEDGDYFLFFGRTGRDVIKDYDTSDTIEFSDIEVPNLEALIRHRVKDIGDDVRIHVNSHMTIIVEDTDKGDLHFMIANF